MAKVFNFLIILTGISVLMSFLGFDLGMTATIRGIFNLTGTGFNDTFFALLIGVGGIFAISAISGIFAGFLGRSTTDSSIRAGLCLALAWFVYDFFAVINYFNGAYSGVVQLSWLPYLIAVIYLPLIIGYIIGLVQFWGGNDI